MKFRSLHLLIAVIWVAVYALIAPSAWAQSAAQSLTFPIIAVDRQGRPVNNLTAESLLILDNKTPIVSGVKLLSAADSPLRLGILIDTSRSQSDNRLYEAGLNAAKDFVNQVFRSEQDRVFFQLFSDSSKATPLLKKNQISGVSFEVRVGGGTALYDAIAMACGERMAAEPHTPLRKVIVLVSDGEDNASHSSLVATENLIARSGVVIFSVGTELSTRSRGKRVLEAISKTSGGAAYTDLSTSDVSKGFVQIRELMNSHVSAELPTSDRQRQESRALVGNKAGKRRAVRAVN